MLQGDRFIPKRSAMDGDLARYSLSAENSDPQTPTSVIKRTPAKDLYKTALASSILGHQSRGSAKSKILSLQMEDGQRTPDKEMTPLCYSPSSPADRIRKRPAANRHIPLAPEKILDAPELMDDYYLNLLDWSPTNVLAVALGQTVYLWNAASGGIEQLCETEREDDHVTSVSWSPDGTHLAVGTNHAEVQLWDAAGLRQVRCMRGHRARVGALAWNGHLVSSGSRDSTVVHNDVRAAQHAVGRLEGAHTQEVCGLRWSPGGVQLASGGNDNMLNIWDAGGGTPAPRHRLAHHQAAVKALAWSPHQSGLLASGGGTADRRICFWNAATGALLQEVDTSSQVSLAISLTDPLSHTPEQSSTMIIFTVMHIRLCTCKVWHCMQ
jgi:cell division cycle 20, cofactor of APC complex